MFGYKYITEQGIKGLDDYKYCGTDLSLMVKYFFRAIWNWMIEYFPLWLAPNMITTLGFCGLLINFAITLYYCPNGMNGTDDVLPLWTLPVFALNLMFYQTMDNLDGKQARRTGTSSPLGELFDHGCDSLFMLLCGLPLFYTVNADPYLVYTFVIFSCVVFYTAHWEEYHTSNLILGYVANPTEMQCLFAGIFMWTYFQGYDWWLLPISEITGDPAHTVSITQGLKYIFLPGIIYTFYDNAVVGYEYCMKNGKSVIEWADPVVSFLILNLIMPLWIKFSVLDIVENQLIWVVVMHSCVFSYLCNQLVVSRVCKMPIARFNPILIIPSLGLLNTILGCPVPEEYVLPGLSCVLLFQYMNFIISVAIQMTSHLGIKVFTIPYQKK